MEPILRQTTVMLSSLLGAAVPFDFLVAASQDADDDVRKLVCVALGGLANRANPDWLIPLLGDRDREVRGYAEAALIPYGRRVPLEPVLHALVRRGPDFEDPLAQVLGAFKEEFPRGVLEDLVHSHPDVAVVILGELGSAAPVDLLDSLLAVPFSERTRAMRYEALLAAKKLKHPGLAPRLVAILRDEQDGSRFSAAAALGALGDPVYLPEILALLPLARPLDFPDVAAGLAGYGERMPVDEMVAYIAAAPAEDGEEIGDLIDALRFASARTPYAFLLAYIQDAARDPWARGIAAKVLASGVGAGLATAQQRDTVRQTLVTLLQIEGEPLFRHYLAYSLGFIKDPLVLDPLMAVVAASDEESFVAIGAAQGLSMLASSGLHAPVALWRHVLDHTADARRKSTILALGSREDMPSDLLLGYFPDAHLKELVHQQLLQHPPSDALDLAKRHLAILADADGDPLGPAARQALRGLEGASA